jgi:hypothetical protein
MQGEVAWAQAHQWLEAQVAPAILPKHILPTLHYRPLVAAFGIHRRACIFQRVQLEYLDSQDNGIEEEMNHYIGSNIPPRRSTDMLGYWAVWLRGLYTIVSLSNVVISRTMGSILGPILVLSSSTMHHFKQHQFLLNECSLPLQRLIPNDVPKSVLC